MQVGITMVVVAYFGIHGGAEPRTWALAAAGLACLILVEIGIRTKKKTLKKLSEQ